MESSQSATVPTHIQFHPQRRYLQLMFALLMSATIFEGYDITIFHLCTPHIMKTFAMSDREI